MNKGNLFLRFAGERFAQAGDGPFLRTPGRDPVYYRELDVLTGRLQQRLQGLGVTPGDRVIVQVDKSAEAVLLYLACLRAGAVYIPLNTAYTAAELDYFIGDAQPQVLVCRPETVDVLSPLAHRLGTPHVVTLGDDGRGSLMADVDQLGGDAAVVPRAGDDLAAILYTSGTTGRSKGAMLSHANLQSNAEALYTCWDWERGDVLLHALPIFHVHGLFVALHCALLGGSGVEFLPRFDTKAVIGALPRCTVMMGVPTFYTRLLDDLAFDASQCNGMRLFIAGSAPLLAETHQAFEARTGHRILERYGMTETGMITSNPYDGERRAGTVGYALPGVSVRIAADDGALLPPGRTGVLEVSGPNVFSGYWRMPDKTASEFRDDGWFITGDLASVDEEGRVTIVGRAKDLIISGGYNVYPKEVESEIDAIGGVRESAVIGVPHADFGEGVVAIVVPDGTVALDEAAIVGPLRDKLARFKQPKRVFLVDELPRNTMGKVQKAQLRETYGDVFR